MIIKFIREIYRYFRYYRHDMYVSHKWLEDLERGDKKGITSFSIAFF
jgi:hypothetical protein